MKISAQSQQGVFLIEALIGILIFSLGVLAMIALGTVAVSAQSDAQYRTEAANLANEIASELALNANRAPQATPAATIAALNASLLPFQHNCNGPCLPGCPFDIAPSASPLVTNWVNKVALALPQVTAPRLQIDTTTLAAFSGVRVTICWLAPADKAQRSYTLVTYIN
jgi:type IV pilus assembly protein PilV